ncbi:MAG TPA: DUF4831 family protein [Draconibacterium sp.]|nr:DUF4831 family protein [Draconibacterium sp.]
MKYLMLIIGITLLLPVYGQRKSKDETVTPAFTDGVIYSLPRTGIKVYVKVAKETFRPGPYAAYAEQLLGIKNVKTKPAVNWVIDDIKIEVFSEPDPEQAYKAIGIGANLAGLSADGCIAGINVKTVENENVEVITNRVGQKNNFDDNSFFEYFTDTPLYASGDSTNNYRPVKLPDEQKISKAAQRVLECRRLQFEIAAGLVDELHPDGEAYKVSLEELKKIEKDYLSLFVGKSTYDKESFSFDYVPKSGGKSEAIFRISEENGIVSATDLSGKPVMIEFEIDKDLTQKYTGLVKSDNPAAGQSGVYYRVPGRATVKLISDMNVIATARVTIAQFGMVAPVPEEFLTGEYSIEYNSETGTIKGIQKK